MLPLPGNTVSPESDRLDRAAAARHVGFLVTVFDQWVAEGLLPGPSIDGQFWTAADLNSALDRHQRLGFQYTPNQKPSAYVGLPNVHRTFVKLSDERRSYHYKRRGLRGPIYGEPNSPGFMKGLIQKEREFAAAHPEPAEATYTAHLATKPIDSITARPASASSPAPSSASPAASPPPGKSTKDIIAKARIRSPALPRERLRQVENQPAPTAQLSGASGTTTPKSVTQPTPAEAAPMPPTAREIIAKARIPATSASPTERLFRTRRRAAVTQAEIARIIRAAKQAGAAELELRLSDSSSILIRLQPDKPVAPDEEIIL